MSNARRFTRAAWPAFLLALAVVVAYAGSLRGGFLWDDDLHITANPTIVGPLGLREIWTSSHANYFPLVLTNFWVQHQLWGLESSGYRVVTLGFHLLAALLLWRVLARLRVRGAGLGAALWALHPIQVESVAWICELKNTQSAVFFLGAVACWILFLETLAPARMQPAAVRNSAGPSRGNKFYALAVTCALLAILSKPSTVMLPVALGLCTWWLRGRVGWRDALRLAPCFVLSAVAAGWTIWEQKYHSGALGPEWSQSLAERFAIAGRSIWFYSGKLLWPASLSFIYPRWEIDARQLTAFLGVASALVGAIGLFRARNTSWARPVIFAALFFVALLFPVLGFFDVYFFRYSYVGDHFQYLASMGPLALLGAGLAAVLPARWPRVGGAMLVPLIMLTALQAAHYYSDEKLWRATVTRNPESAMAWAQLGSSFVRSERHEEALQCFQRALRINPRHPEALNHLGCEYLRAGRTREAIAELERAVAARSGFAEARTNLALALLQAGRGEAALEQSTVAQRERPDAAEPRYAMMKILNALGRSDDAIAQGEAALRLGPDRADIHDELGTALSAAGRVDDAVVHLRHAIGLNPRLASPHNTLGVLLAKGGRLPDALEHFNDAVRLDPNYADAHVNRGGALASLRRLPEAGEAFARAVQLQPDSAAAHAYLGQILQALNREAEARPHLEKAAQLQRGSP